MSGLAQRVAEVCGQDVLDTRRLAGGDISGATRIELADGAILVAKQGKGVAIEGAMLEAMGRTGVAVLKVHHFDDELLLMDWVQSGGGPGWGDLARQLAYLHAPSDEDFGWEVDYHFGDLAIPNRRSGNWAQFWADNRLLVHCPHVDGAIAGRIEALAGRIGDILPTRPPAALLHGDLWGGNVLFLGGQLAALIDPACYYGDREVDAAMTTLFDHPPRDFFDALALDAGWEERQPVYRLWPLLVHLRLFGGSYRGAVEQALHACGA